MAIKHRVLVVGTGSIGERHVRCFLQTGRADVSLCDVNPELARSVAGRYGVEQIHTDLQQGLAAKPHAVVIATPADCHLKLATEAARAGCHLLIEKPLSTRLDGHRPLREIVHANGLTAMVAYVIRSHPALVAMKRAIDEGRFGRPLHLYSTCGQHFPTYRPAYREIYYRSHETGGGCVQDALTHALNTAEWLVGPVDCLAADATHQSLDGVDVEDTVNVIARHGDVLASYSFNQYQAPNEFGITVAAERGTCRFEYHAARWRWMDAPDTTWHDQTLAGNGRDAIFISQANSFLNAVESRGPTVCSLEEGIQTLKTNLAVLRAVHDKTWISLE